MAGEKLTLDRRVAADLAVVLVCYAGVAALIAVLMYLLSGSGSGWLTFDATRLQATAGAIIRGLRPYIGFVDQKPPLLFFVVPAMALLAPAGSLDILIMSLVNVLCAVLIYWIGRNAYGNLSGFSAGLLFLVAAVLVQGSFPFSGQFAVLLLILAFMLGREDHFAASGLCLGLAMGFNPYAFLAIPGLLFLARVGGRRRLVRIAAFLAMALGAFLLLFGALDLSYGPGAARSAVNWTLGIAPSPASGYLAVVPAYQPSTLLALIANLLASVILVLPILLIAAVSIWRKGLRTDDEYAFGLFIAFFLLTLLFREYLSSWILMLPFLVLLACRGFAVRSAEEPEERPEGSVLQRLAGFIREAWSSPDAFEAEAVEGRGKIVFSAPVTGSPAIRDTLPVKGGLVPYRLRGRIPEGGEVKGEGPASHTPGEEGEGREAGGEPRV